jgi:hydroxyacylglutathione hydrolase
MLVLESFPVGTLGCNCSLLYDSETLEALIIDPGNDAPFLLEKIRSKKVKVRKLLHTHAHFDHIGQSNTVRRATNATLHLHEGDLFLYEALAQQGMLFGASVDTDIGVIDNWLENEERIGFSAESNGLLQVLHTPGHTPGSCSFYCEALDEPVLFSGDTLFANSIGRTDLPGGDQVKLLRSIHQRILPLPEETTCIPGHGPNTTLYKEKKNNPFLRGLL